MRFSACLLAALLGTLTVCSADTRVLSLSDTFLPADAGGSLRIVSTKQARLLANGGVWLLSNTSQVSPGGPLFSSDARIGRLGPDGVLDFHLRAENASGGGLITIPGPPPQAFAYDEAAGAVAYTRVLADSDQLWEVSSAGTQRLVRQGGEAAPGRSSDPLGSFAEEPFAQTIGYGPRGELYFSGRLASEGEVDPAGDAGVWVSDGVTERLYLREGDPAPGLPGALLGDVGPTTASGGIIIINLTPPPAAPFVASRGGIAFQARIALPGFDNVFEYGVWADRGAGLELVARTSTPAPGLPDGYDFAPSFSTSFFGSVINPAFSEPRVNARGDVAFAAHANVGGSGFEGLWRQRPGGSLEPMLVVDDPGAPAAGETLVTQLSNDFSLSDSGHVAAVADVRVGVFVDDEFGQRVETRSEDAIYRIDPDGASSVVAITDNTPGGFESQRLSDARVNDAGQVLWNTLQDGDDIEFFLTATDRDGSPTEVVRWGDSINIGSAGEPDLRTVNDFQLLDFDDAGRVLYEAYFEDDTSALVVSDAAAAPSIRGDYNGDGLTDAADFDAWRATYGSEVRVGDGSDGNLNDRVDAADYTLLRDLLGGVSLNDNLAAIPEPAGLVAALMPSCLCFRRKNRR